MLRALGDDRVRFAGLIPEEALPPVYAAADLYVWPALREAYGLAMLEAQAAGLPVVAGQEGGVAEVVADGRSGVLAAPRDPAASRARCATCWSGRSAGRPWAKRRRGSCSRSAASGGRRRAVAALAAADAIRAMRR